MVRLGIGIIGGCRFDFGDVGLGDLARLRQIQRTGKTTGSQRQRLFRRSIFATTMSRFGKQHRSANFGAHARSPLDRAWSV